MEKKNKKVKNPVNFVDEYHKIINNDISKDASFVVKTEWNQPGDFFQELSLYDQNTLVQTTWATTLLK